MPNTVTVGEIKRRGMAAIEEGLRQGSLHIIKRNKSAAVILSEEDYQRLTEAQMPAVKGLTAMQWLLAQPLTGTRDRNEIDAALARERNW